MLKSSSGTARKARTISRFDTRPAPAELGNKAARSTPAKVMRCHRRRPSEGQFMTTDTQEHSRAGSRLNLLFSRFAQTVAFWTGNPIAFLLALAVVLVWIVTGPIFSYSDTWQLVINTGTTIVTFLMVFLIQNTQNRDILTVQLKLSELVLAMKGAEDKFASIEDLTDEELEELHDQCRTRAETTLTHMQSRRGKNAGGNDADAGQNNPKPRAVAHRAKTQKKTSRTTAKS
jgi:low affinity Fe/Cu permease